VVMEETLEQGLTQLFGGNFAAAPLPAEAGAPKAPAESGDAASLVRQAREIYDRAIAAQRAGDWARYGQEIGHLGEVLRRLEESAAPR
jgi:uncharacterized membrane protein (UPF0182 family)